MLCSLNFLLCFWTRYPVSNVKYSLNEILIVFVCFLNFSLECVLFIDISKNSSSIFVSMWTVKCLENVSDEF